jgi:hypothetical protein
LRQMLGMPGHNDDLMLRSQFNRFRGIGTVKTLDALMIASDIATPLRALIRRFAICNGQNSSGRADIGAAGVDPQLVLALEKRVRAE